MGPSRSGVLLVLFLVALCFVPLTTGPNRTQKKEAGTRGGLNKYKPSLEQCCAHNNPKFQGHLPKRQEPVIRATWPHKHPQVPHKHPQMPHKHQPGPSRYPGNPFSARTEKEGVVDTKRTARRTLARGAVYAVVMTMTLFVSALEILAILHSLGGFFLPFLMYLYSGTFLTMFQLASIQDVDDCYMSVFNPYLSECIAGPLWDVFPSPVGHFGPYGPHGGTGFFGGGGLFGGLFGGPGPFDGLGGRYGYGGPGLFGGGMFGNQGRYGDPCAADVMARNLAASPFSLMYPNIPNNFMGTQGPFAHNYLPPQGTYAPFLRDGGGPPLHFRNPLGPPGYYYPPPAPPPTPICSCPNLYPLGSDGHAPSAGQGDSNPFNQILSYLRWRCTPARPQPPGPHHDGHGNDLPPNTYPSLLNFGALRGSPPRRPRTPPPPGASFIDTRRNNAEIYEVCSRASLIA